MQLFEFFWYFSLHILGGFCVNAFNLEYKSIVRKQTESTFYSMKSEKASKQSQIIQWLILTQSKNMFDIQNVAPDLLVCRPFPLMEWISIHEMKDKYSLTERLRPYLTCVHTWPAFLLPMPCYRPQSSCWLFSPSPEAQWHKSNTE